MSVWPALSSLDPTSVGWEQGVATGVAPLAAGEAHLPLQFVATAGLAGVVEQIARKPPVSLLMVFVAELGPAGELDIRGVVVGDEEPLVGIVDNIIGRVYLGEHVARVGTSIAKIRHIRAIFDVVGGQGNRIWALRFVDDGIAFVVVLPGGHF